MLVIYTEKLKILNWSEVEIQQMPRSATQEISDIITGCNESSKLP